MRDFDQQRFIHRLPAWIIRIQCPAHFFFRSQNPIWVFGVCVAGVDAEDDVWGVECFAERVCVFAEYGFADVVDEVVFFDLDERGRGIGAPHPDLAVHHAGVEWA